MNILFDYDHLYQLLTNLYTLTGIYANILNLSGKDLQIKPEHTPFCQLINSTQEGHARCEGCDAEAVKRCSESRKAYSYRCHAGLCETVLPIYSGEKTIIAYLLFGQLLDETPMEQQWEETARTLDWYPGDREELKRAFFQFRQHSAREIRAYAELLEVMASYINLQGIIRTAEYSDLQKLETYLSQHYMEKLSLATISADLGIGRTKLCALAKQLSGGNTLSHMIAQRRVDAAKILLSHSGAPISAVAEAVGISDYNYFSKVFRTFTGMTPTAFRKKTQI